MIRLIEKNGEFVPIGNSEPVQWNVEPHRHTEAYFVGEVYIIPGGRVRPSRGWRKHVRRMKQERQT